jgi:hypothetical protein
MRAAGRAKVFSTLLHRRYTRDASVTNRVKRTQIGGYWAMRRVYGFAAYGIGKRMKTREKQHKNGIS